MINKDTNVASYSGHAGEEILCDGCGKSMALMDYYNQDGLCVKCFMKYVDGELI